MREFVAAGLPTAGTGPLQLTGQAFKAAGWRTVSLVGAWATGDGEPLVVLTALPPAARSRQRPTPQLRAQPAVPGTQPAAPEPARRRATPANSSQCRCRPGKIWSPSAR